MSGRNELLQAAFERGCLSLGRDPSQTSMEELLRDLTDAKQRAQRHLDRNERLQANFYEHAPGGLIMVGADLRIRVLNSGVHAVLPVVPDPIGRLLSGGVPFKPLVEVILLAMERGARQTRECVAGRFDLLIRAEALEDGGAIAVIADVSSIQQAARARSDFVSNVSHELRTPVTSILGYSETLLAQPEGLDADTLLMLQAIDRNANRLTRIFDELLDLARIEARLQEMDLNEVDLRPMIQDLARTWSETADLRGIRLKVELPDLPMVARVHIQAFDRILGNLVAMPSNTARARARSAFVLAWPVRGWWSRSKTKAQELIQPTRAASLSASTGWTRGARVTWGAQAWVWHWSNTYAWLLAPRSVCEATPGTGRPFRCAFRPKPRGSAHDLDLVAADPAHQAEQGLRPLLVLPHGLA